MHTLKLVIPKDMLWNVNAKEPMQTIQKFSVWTVSSKFCSQTLQFNSAVPSRYEHRGLLTGRSSGCKVMWESPMADGNEH